MTRPHQPQPPEDPSLQVQAHEVILPVVDPSGFRDIAEVALRKADTSHGQALASALEGVYASRAAREARRQMATGDVAKPLYTDPGATDFKTKALILDAADRKDSMARGRAALEQSRKPKL